ncbi:MAG: GNAT family N-acetyltransferase [Caldilineaceae bacterium]
MPDELTLTRMNESEAREVASWEYVGDYAAYNADAEHFDDTVRSFLNPDYAYYAVWHDELALTGFCCYGADAQVPGGDYSEGAVDIGLGLRPDLVGCGLGSSFLGAVMQNAARTRYAGIDADKMIFRATIAAFNGRSLRLFGRAGFITEQEFTIEPRDRSGEQLRFVVVVRRPSPRPDQLLGST